MHRSQPLLLGWAIGIGLVATRDKDSDAHTIGIASVDNFPFDVDSRAMARSGWPCSLCGALVVRRTVRIEYMRMQLGRNVLERRSLQACTRQVVTYLHTAHGSSDLKARHFPSKSVTSERCTRLWHTHRLTLARGAAPFGVLRRGKPASKYADAGLHSLPTHESRTPHSS